MWLKVCRKRIREVLICICVNIFSECFLHEIDVDWLIEARIEDHEKLYVSFKGIMAETGEKA